MDEREFKVGVALWAVFLLVVFPICWPFWKIKDWWDGRRAAPAAGVRVPDDSATLRQINPPDAGPMPSICEGMEKPDLWAYAHLCGWRSAGVEACPPDLTDRQLAAGLDAYWRCMGGIEPDTTDAVVAAMRAALGVTLPLAPVCKQAAGCPDPAWCARAGVCLNVPAKDGVLASDGSQQ